MNDPFRTHDVPEAARRAAEALMARLRSDSRFAPCRFFERGQGKMFGALVARDAGGREVVLWAFSGALAALGEHDGWCVEGFAPPVFNVRARAQFWPRGQAELEAWSQRARDCEAHPERRAAQRALEALRRRHAAELDEDQREGQRRRAARATLRERAGGAASAQQLEALRRESQHDKAERRRLRARQEREAAPLVDELDGWRARSEALHHHRAERSRALWRRLHAGYELQNWLGERAPLAGFFEGAPPTGAGDCAAPKLLHWARERGLTPEALAEFWWGAPPPGGGRVSGALYPACAGKCGPLLPFQLRGVPVAWQPRPYAPPTEALVVLWRDEHIIAVDKPAGLLSVPGRGARLQDSAQTRLRERWGPEVTAAHRLDQATSGVLLLARRTAVLSALHSQFAQRTAHKVYRARLEGRLEGPPPGAWGLVDLPLRLDPHDRPRQVVDWERGKPASTRWRVLGGNDRTTDVELVPLTGRTHQLRVHASHPDGLGCPIVGDELYGLPGERLLLHAAELQLEHPVTSEPIRVRSEAPWSRPPGANPSR